METTEHDVPIEEQAQAAEDFTRGLVDAFDLGAQVDTVIDDDTVLVEVTGENLGLLVGPRGATLTAIEELVRTVVQRQTDGHGARIHVDVAGYRAKRRDALEEFTQGAGGRGGRERASEAARADVGVRPQGRARHRGRDRRCRDRVRRRRPPSPGGAAPRVTDTDLDALVAEAQRRGFVGPGARQPPARARGRSGRDAGPVAPSASWISGPAAGCPGWCSPTHFPDASVVLLDAHHRRCDFLRRGDRGPRLRRTVPGGGGSSRGARPRPRAAGRVRPRDRAVVRPAGDDSRVRGRVPHAGRAPGRHGAAAGQESRTDATHADGQPRASRCSASLRRSRCTTARRPRQE